MNRILFLMTFSFLCLITACQDAPQSKDEASSAKMENKPAAETKTLVADSKTVSADKEEAVQEKTENVKPTSIEEDIQFIRDKYAIIRKATHYKTVPFKAQCDERTMVKLDRKYNEKGELSYLQYHDCGGHGCSTKHHYYWEGELIFIFHVNDYSPGSTHIIEEHRTYFKNGKMFRCLEKKAHYYEGQAPMAELLKKASNDEVDCTPEKRTKNLSELEDLSIDKAKDYFCNF